MKSSEKNLTDGDHPWLSVQLIFESVLDAPQWDRESVLQKSCKGDEALVEEVRGLLKAFEDSKESIESFADRIAIAESEHRSKLHESLLDDYQIVRELNRGGQGVVYEAIRKETNEKVAIKFLLSGPFASQDVKLRFRREVELVESLRHPGIVRILDSGLASGHQYYVMSFVEGTHLDEYACEHCQTIDDRVRLFIRICEAIQHAHSYGVIHRDLKPSNILVDNEGMPHVVDFGLARDTERDSDETLKLSMTGQVMGTMSYMSPEQAAGNHSQTEVSSDVYSLGVMLYQVLADDLPYELGNGVAEDIQTIQTASPKSLRGREPHVAGDLETIVRKTLSKEKSRRYLTAGALAEDLERFLDGKPIDAKRDSPLYVLNKVAKRHWITALTAASLISLLAMSLVISLILWQRARSARNAEALSA
ncbi:MAG: serine/threonine-protein kinase, partial [Planctomycetota bacterium]